jgi:outer membrane receptor protein involved in Fe transport
MAALIVATCAHAQTSPESIRRLEEENAALRKRIAEFEARYGTQTPAATATPTQGPVAAPAASAAATPPATAGRLATDEGVTTLTPFEVRSEKDYGYLRTNTTTATRIGVAIQTVPISVSVISEDFIRDANLTDIQDVLRYQASSAGDTRMGVLQPATGFTPSGNMSLRGFPINSRLRNGLLRYNNYSLDNVDRVEVIKGPAAVFFGQAFPGGVINYVTKQPEFRTVPTTLSYSYGGYDTRMGTQRATLDSNNRISDKTALRVVGAWDNALGDRRFEFQDGFTVTPNIAFRPFADSRLKVTLEAEFARRQRNQDDTSWVYPEQWFRDYQSPPANLIAAAGLSGNANPVEAYRARIFAGPGNWIADRRTAANDQSLALWTEPMRHGAFITDRAGNRVFDEKFNYYGSGTYSDEENTTASVVTEASPTKWFDLRHSYTHDDSRYTEVKSSASPNADGVTWQTLNGILARDYILEARTHQLDLVFKHRMFETNHKFLVGGLHRVSNNAFTGTNAANLTGTGQFPFFGNLPGTFDKPDEGYVSPIPAQFRSTTFAGNFNQQYVRNRAGRILTPVELYSQYDPAIHPFPDIRRITEVSRGLIDRSRPTRKEKYINYQATTLQDRLTVMLGYREEKQTTVGQLVEANPPWFTVPEYALQNVPQSQWAQYGLSAIFSRPRTTKGESKMAGVSYAVVKDVNVYASYSETFLPSGVTYIGGDYDPATVSARATSLGLNPQTELARLESQGGLRETVNEKGKNIEFGVKTSLLDNKIVSTLSFFRLERANRTIDDGQRQFDEVLNWTGPGRTGTNNRIVRWYSNDAVQRTEGTELEVIWTPIRNYQAVVSGSWMWTAKTVSDKSLDITPTSSAAAIATRAIVFGNRLPFAPEYRLNLFQKYTLTDNVLGRFGRGASVGVGARYASEINIALDQNTNPDRGGLTAGDYVVFDTVFGLPVEVFGYNMRLSLNVTNVFDKEYSEGGFNLSPPRSWLLTTGISF